MFRFMKILSSGLRQVKPTGAGDSQDVGLDLAMASYQAASFESLGPLSLLGFALHFNNLV
jgi:hypothetical protein